VNLDAASEQLLVGCGLSVGLLQSRWRHVCCENDVRDFTK